LKKLPCRVILLIFFFFPLVLWAAEDKAALLSGAALRAELSRLLREEGFDIEELPLPEYGGKGASIVAALPDPKSGTKVVSPAIFILAVPLTDTAEKPAERPGQNAGKFPFGIETALSFLEKARENQLDKRVAAAFLEDTPGDLRGLEDLAASLDYPENAALVYLDFIEPPGEIVIHHEAKGGIAPLAMVEPLPEILEQQDIPSGFGVRSHELHNLGLAEGPAVLERARSLEIPAILLTASGSVSAAADSEILAAALAEYAADLQWEIGGMDTHYSLFTYGKHIFFLSEGLTLVLIIFLAGVGIALRIRGFMPRRLVRGLPPASAAHPPQSGQEKPPLGRWSDHCAHGAVFLAILGILWGTFLDLSCAPAFIWVLAFTILGAALHFAPAVFICALLSPFKGAETIFLALRGEAFTGSASLGPGIYLLPACLLLPCLFLIFRGIILLVEKKKSRISPEELEKSGL
jgi:hypothetical protein